MSKHHIDLTVNGRRHSGDIEARISLSDFLRDDAGYTGVHVGCEHGVCGACTVIVDGLAVRSCLMLAVQADGTQVTTVEGLAQGAERHPVQQAFIDCHGLQCGFCTPGMMMSATALLRHTPNPSQEQIEHALEGNLCRCTGYVNIVAAVKQAAGAVAAGSKA